MPNGNANLFETSTKSRNTFQPDFIVKFVDGTVGIFDTKPIDHRVEDTAVKANALSKYLRDINTNRGILPPVIGGIVVKDGTQFYVYVGTGGYHDYAADPKGWMNFNELLRNINDGMKLTQRIEQYLAQFKKN